MTPPPGGNGVSRRRLLKAAGLGVGLAAVPGSVRGALGAGGVGPEPLQLALVHAPTLGDLRALAVFDDTHARTGDWVEILLWPGDRQRLERAGLRYRITESDLLARDAATRAGASPSTLAAPGQRADYRRLSDYEADLAELAAGHPALARLHQLPYRSHEGRSAYSIEIAARVDQDDGRPVFYMDGLHHAREWPSGELVIMFAFDLLTAYGSDPRVSAILDTTRIILIPVVNVDGFDYSRESLAEVAALGVVAGGQGAYWRKNRRTFVDDVADWNTAAEPARPARAGIYGVDLNRNYSYHWGGAGTTWDYTDQTYMGPPPYEPEIRNVHSIFASRQITAAVTNHTFSGLVLRPWGDTWSDAPDEARLRAVGDSMADTNGYHSMKGIGLYPTSGTTEDWAYAVFGSLAFTFEHGHEFHPPYSASIAAMYLQNREAFLQGAEAAASPVHHGIIRGTVSAPVRLTVRRQAYTPFAAAGRGITETHETGAGLEVGAFEYHVCPSTRPIASKPESFQVTFTNASGASSRAVQVGRGETVDLGDVTP